MKASPTMQQMVQQLVECHAVDLSAVGAFLRLDLPDYDSLVIDRIGVSQMAVAHYFEEGCAWKIDREVIFFTGDQGWIPMEITQMATGWVAYARLDPASQRIVRINHCGQEKLAEFSERWAEKIIRQNWLEQGLHYEPWTPLSSKEVR